MVGVRGFEPPTPSSRTRCATSLRYTPTNWCWRAYTVMTDFPQVFFKKTRSTIIHFLSVSPFLLSSQSPFSNPFFSLIRFCPLARQRFIILFLKFFRQSIKFLPMARQFCRFKSCLPLFETSIASLADFFVPDRFCVPHHFLKNSSGSRLSDRVKITPTGATEDRL